MADNFATCPAESLVCLSTQGRLAHRHVAASHWPNTTRAHDPIGRNKNGAASHSSTPPVIVPCSQNLINVCLSHCLLPLEDPILAKVGQIECQQSPLGLFPTKHVSETHCNAWYLFAQRQISCADLIMGVLILVTTKNFFGQHLSDI